MTTRTSNVSLSIRDVLRGGGLASYFSPSDIHARLPDIEPSSINNALSRMARAGELRSAGHRNNRTYGKVETDAAEVLKNLLDAMAKAEPVLRRMVRVQKALEDI